MTSIESPKLTRKPHQATLEKHSESQIEKKQVQIMPIYEAIHKVNTHLLTEESLGCQPLLFVVPEGKVREGYARVFFSADDEALLRQLAETETLDLGDDLFAQRIEHRRSQLWLGQPYSSCRTRSST